MPKYFYTCEKCNIEFSIYHSIDDILTDCSTCHASGSLIRVPSQFFDYRVKEKGNKPGQIVKEYIEETREEIKKEKNKRKDYK
jgi:predicted nucleic acid-binding Zn ribbon protein